MTGDGWVRFVKGDVVKVFNEYNYTRKEDAFVQFVLQIIYDQEPAEALKNSAIGTRGREKGIDAFFVEYDKKIVYVVQGKYTRDGLGTFGRDKVVDPELALKWLQNTDFISLDITEDLKQIIKEYQQCVKNGFSVELALVVFGSLTQPAKDEIAVFETKLPDRHRIEIYDADELKRIYLTRHSPYSGKGPDVEFPDISDTMMIERTGTPRSIVFNVKGKKIAELVNRYSFDLFQINVRNYLGEKNPVNKEISKTLTSPDKINFWHYNLGINAVCDSFSYNGKTKMIKVKNMRIVNGCQTCTTLAEAESRLDDSIIVMLRLVESKDEALTMKLTVRNNTQNPIRGRDLLSEDPIQRELQDSFNAVIAPPFFYQRKRGEWENLPAHTKQRYKISGKKYRVIDNEQAAKALMAFKQREPRDAKANKRLFFVFETANGYYEKIFSSTTTEELLVADYTQKQVAAKVREFSTEYNKTAKNNFVGKSNEEVEYYKSRSVFLPHATEYIVALIGEMLDVKNGVYAQWKHRASKLYELLINDPSKFDNMYNWIVSLLHTHINIRKRSEEETGQVFNGRNYLLRTESYREINESKFDNIQQYKKQVMEIIPVIPE